MPPLTVISLQIVTLWPKWWIFSSMGPFAPPRDQLQGSATATPRAIRIDPGQNQQPNDLQPIQPKFSQPQETLQTDDLMTWWLGHIDIIDEWRWDFKSLIGFVFLVPTPHYTPVAGKIWKNVKTSCQWWGDQKGLERDLRREERSSAAKAITLPVETTCPRSSLNQTPTLGPLESHLHMATFTGDL